MGRRKKRLKRILKIIPTSSGIDLPQAATYRHIILRYKYPKETGRIWPLGIPTVADRIAQMVFKEQLEPEMEKQFHPDSYDYHPNKSALEAVGQARKRCWKSDWVLNLDIKGFFDNIDHELMMKALCKTHR